tara:strand:- start:684 stop:908 length:225 start_codon:yes stop_codon:yes gene_type:complete
MLFLLLNVDKSDQLPLEGIKYSKYIPYLKYLKYLDSSRAGLEIFQQGVYSHNARALEAFLYKRKLITNCQAVLN